MKYVIAGAGPAGVIAAETIRAEDAEGEILLLGAEPHPPYSRMAIPYVLTGKIDDKGTYLRKGEDYYKNLSIDYRQGMVEQLDGKGKSLSLAGGEKISFDRLLIATGSHPIKPPVDGLDQPGVHHCWTLEDAEKIMALAHPDAHVVLIGAGFIGCIILESLKERGVNLTAVEAGDRMVPRMMNETAGGMIADWCRNKGVDVRLSARVKAITSGHEGVDGAVDEDTLTVNLDDGSKLPAHLVVVAAGVAPNAGFVEGSGIEVNLGIKVDRYLETAVDGVFAAGDVAEGPDFSTGGWSLHAIQPTAADHGRIAGQNMCGLKVPFQGSINMNVLDTLGLISTSFGAWAGVDGGDSAEIVDREGSRYISLQFKDDKLVGAVTLGRTDHVGVVRGLIQNKVGLGGWKERLKEDPTRVMDAYVALSQV